MPQDNTIPTKRGRAKNNLSSFDISQIEADLMAVESESLKLDPQAHRNDQIPSLDKSSPDKKESENIINFKSHPVNVVNFNPDNSKLLHKVLRTDIKTSGSKVTTPALKSPLTKQGEVKKPKKESQPLKVSTALRSTVKAGGIDGFKKPGAPIERMEAADNKSPIAETSTRPTINTAAVALTGMSRANQFNRFSLEQHKTSLANQIEKNSLFEKSLDGDVEIFDKGLQTNAGRKVYNVRGRKSMLGGVDQHNLGPGKIRRVLGYRPMKFLMPIFAVLLVGGYVMYLNLPTISIKVAENKSGVAVSEPSYTPAGYRLSGPIEAETGKVAMNFKGRGQAAYNISQKVSDWDSKALLENKILKETKEYSAYTDRGLTIYVYGSKATWVNQGKVYEIDIDSANLDVEEMVRIAGSM